MKIWLQLTFVNILHVSCQLFPICDESVKRVTPKATIYTESKDFNTKPTGYRVSTLSRPAITLRCFANFPVQWVFDVDLDAGDEVKETTVFNIREFQGDFRNQTYEYMNSMVLYYESRINKTQVFSCQAVSSPCVRRFFTSIPFQDPTGFYTDIYWRAELNVPEIKGVATFTPMKSGTGNKCDALYYYGRNDSRWSFCCKTSDNQSADISNIYRVKDASTLENIQRKSPLQPSDCSTEVANLSDFCEVSKMVSLNSLASYGIKCGATATGMYLHHPIIKIRQSISQDSQTPSHIYLSWEDINPEEMIKFQVENPLFEFKNKSVTIQCLISLSYFAHGGFIALRDSQEGLVTYNDDVDWNNERERYDREHNAYKVRKTLVIKDTTEALYCFAPVWNASNWVNKSVAVIVLEPTPLKIINLEEREKVTWNLGDKNRSLDCVVNGAPVTEIQWILKNKVIRSQVFSSMNATTLNISLDFVEVDKSIEGIYRCLATNYVGSTHASVQLFVHDQVQARIIGGSIGAITIIFLGLLWILFILWRKNLKQRKALRLLSPKEIDDFKEGGSDNPQTLRVWSQPYNTDYEIDRHRLIIDETSILGKGAFGVVYNGKINISKNGAPSIFLPVAVKTVPKDVDIIYLKALLSELKIMAAISSAKHANIVMLVGACTQNLHKREAFVALEFCSNGSLKEHLTDCRTKLNEDYQNISWVQQSCTEETKEKIFQLITWSWEIADGMNFLASKNIIHGDLAARNILLDENFHCKISDFGLARILADPVYIKKKSSQCPLPWKWMAIESLESLAFSIKSDVWSYGILQWEIYSLGLNPYPGVTWNTQFLEDLKNGMRSSHPPLASAEIYDVMQACWRAVPSQRITFKEIYQIFKQIQTNTNTLGRKISETSNETTYIYV